MLPPYAQKVSRVNLQNCPAIKELFLFFLTVRTYVQQLLMVQCTLKPSQSFFLRVILKTKQILA